MEPWQQRVIDEEAELAKKHDALATFIPTDVFHALELEDQMLMHNQLVAMDIYLSMLRQRIARFKP